MSENTSTTDARERLAQMVGSWAEVGAVVPDYMDHLIPAALEAATDDDLRAEVARRGMSVVDAERARIERDR